MKLPVTLQINTAPVDISYLPKFLENQLADFGESCSEILITIETRQSKKTRWKSAGWDDGLASILQLCESLKKQYPHLKVNPIDYSLEARKEVSRFFLKTQKKLVPFKDFRGGPYYSYYFGLYSASQPYVLHLDSDMIFSGDGNRWLEQALSLIKKDETALFISPIIGPPVKKGQKMPQQHKKRYNPVSTYEYLGNGFRYKDLSTRVFLVEKVKLRRFCLLTYPNVDQILKSVVRKTKPYHTPERSLSKAMQKEGLYRVDFQGDPGLYSIHAQVARWPEFLEMHEFVIRKIKEGFFLEEDRGLQDLNPAYLAALKESFHLEQKN
jgi:hypothetical protein